MDIIGSPIEGNDVHMYGAVTRYKEGVILSTNIKADVNGVQHTDFFEYSCLPSPGDSGGALLMVRDDGKLTLVGLNICQTYVTDDPDDLTPVWGGGCKWRHIAAELRVTAIAPMI